MQTEEIKGNLLGMAMVFNRADENKPGVIEEPTRGNVADASRVGMFVNRVRNRVGTVTEQGQAVVKVALIPQQELLR